LVFDFTWVFLAGSRCLFARCQWFEEILIAWDSFFSAPFFKMGG
jgi:hypothetical protein